MTAEITVAIIETNIDVITLWIYHNYSGIQESGRGAHQKSLKTWSFGGKPISDLAYGDISEATQLIEEVSKLREAYMRAILNSDS